ncbi:hypothetical protein DFH27DRAFT_544764 [Peziza echinospora]|nr:hypothetical protein DFH27DRAFT_544764 [Peziza echinospora]
MASLDLSQNGPSINRSYKSLVESPASKNPSPTHASWAVFAVSSPLQNAFMQGPPKDSVVKVQSTGEGELSELIEEFSEGKVQFAFVKVTDTNTGLAKFVLIGWCGEGVPERVKGYFNGHMAAISKVLHGYHVQITARSEAHLSPESIIKKVADASGAKYSAGTASTSAPSSRPPPPTASKPAYTPSSTSGSSRSAAYGYKPAGKVDNDGWGEDAPQITRSKLENVQSAYKPTKVDLAALKAMPTSTTSGPVRPTVSDKPDVVRGAYVPVGKVDIAAIRAASRAKEERPEPVKGAYQPIGKVDIAAIRAQSKPPTERSEAREEETSLPVSQRASAYSTPTPQAERLTSLPKPKPAKKFGAGAPSFGTKPITPGGFGAVPSSAPVGTANKDFASEGGKTPAQIWAEKKARERGEPIPSFTPAAPASSHSADAEEEQQPSFTGVGALKNKFGGAPPMGAQYSGRSNRSASPPPPAFERPAAASPGFPPRPSAQETAPPPPPPQPPRSPTPPSPPTPEPTSPVRLVMPVGRGSDLVQQYEEEPRTSVPVASLSNVVPQARDVAEDEPVRERGQIAAESTTGIRARVEYDYEKAEGNEIDLAEGEIVTNIDMVDDDWWAGTNPRGETGLFPSNYVVVIEEEEQEEIAPPPTATRPVPALEAEPPKGASDKPSAVAQYDYEAAEGNEISFPDGAIIEDLEFPDDDWWEGTYNGKRGLFPANYVELRQ